MMNSPRVLILLVVLIPLGIVLRNRYIRGRADLGTLGGAWRVHHLYDVFVVKWFFSSTAFLGFTVFAVLSLTEFVTRQYPVVSEPVGQDVVFVIDISRSMLAQDIEPDRMHRAARMVRGVLESTKHTRFGLAVFKGSGSLLVPLTEDVDALQVGLTMLGPDLVTTPGTNVEKGIEAALDALKPATGTKKFIILYSDGEALTGDARRAAFALRNAGVRLYSIGVGTAAGAPVPDGAGGFVRDRNGDQVISRLDQQPLHTLARETGGEFFTADNPAAAGRLLEVLDFPGRGEAMEIHYEPIDNYRTFLSLALVCLFIHIGVRIVRWQDAF